VLHAYCLVTQVFLVYYTGWTKSLSIANDCNTYVRYTETFWSPCTMARISIATQFFINFLNSPSVTPVIAEDSFVITDASLSGLLVSKYISYLTNNIFSSLVPNIGINSTSSSLITQFYLQTQISTASWPVLFKIYAFTHYHRVGMKKFKPCRHWSLR
jgi:hypothetical protein